MTFTTPAQLEANRANAQRSTGPKTPVGKAVSAKNHFRHGLTGVFRVLAWENRADFDKLIDGLLSEHKPSTVTETVLVEKMAQALWLSRRAQTLQHTTLKREVPGCWDEKQLALYIRYQTTNDRAFHKCLNELLKLRAEKRKQEIGFESQRRKETEESRQKACEEPNKTMSSANRPTTFAAKPPKSASRNTIITTCCSPEPNSITNQSSHYAPRRASRRRVRKRPAHPHQERRLIS